MKLKIKNIKLIAFIILLNSLIFLIFYIIKIPSIIVLNPLILIFGSIELIFFNIFSIILFNQYSKYKKRIFGEIIKFKITFYLIANIILIFLIILTVFYIIDFSPSITKSYDEFNYIIEEKYIATIDKINKYKFEIENLIYNINETNLNKLKNDSNTILLIYNNYIISSTNNDKILNLIASKDIKEVTIIENEDISFLAYNNNNITLAYLIPADIIENKRTLFTLISKFKNIYSQKKNAPLLILLSLFLVIFPVLFFQIYFLFRYISYTINPLGSLVNQFKKVSSNIYSPLEIPKRRFDEFSFLILQFNRMQKQLEQRSILLKYQERFETLAKVTSKFAHEIKNPLTPISLSCELLSRKYPYEDNFRQYLLSKIKIIQENVESIRESINKFYTFSSKDNASKVYISINDFLNSICNFWISDSIDIELILPDKNIYVYTQKEDFESIFNNLIINSYESSIIDENNKCRILIKLFIENEKYFNIIYSDDGLGIDEKDKDKIFEPYFTTKEKGSGLGLAIIKSNIENMGGKIDFIGNAKSGSNLYKGATFLIRLPYFNNPD